jgi:hypothetical protein
MRSTSRSHRRPLEDLIVDEDGQHKSKAAQSA